MQVNSQLYSQGQSPQYPLGKRLCGAHSLLRRSGKEKKILPVPLPGIEPRTVSPYLSTCSDRTTLASSCGLDWFPGPSFRVREPFEE